MSKPFDDIQDLISTRLEENFAILDIFVQAVLTRILPNLNYITFDILR